MGAFTELKSNGRTSIKGIWIGFEKDNKCNSN